MPTENFNLPLITDNLANDVVRDMNALAEATDGALKGLGDSKANNTDLTTLNNKVTQHLAETIFYDGVFVNGFTGAIKYGKNTHGIVHIKFIINTIPTITPNTVICTLPTGFKPSQHVVLSAIITNSSPYDNKLAFTINPNGNLAVAYNSGLPTGSSLGVSGEVLYHASVSN